MKSKPEPNPFDLPEGFIESPRSKALVTNGPSPIQMSGESYRSRKLCRPTYSWQNIYNRIVYKQGRYYRSSKWR